MSRVKEDVELGQGSRDDRENTTEHLRFLPGLGKTMSGWSNP